MPLGWRDVCDYHEATGNLPTRQERIAVKELSDAFCAGKFEGINPLSIAPAFREEET